jgi:hypothetical protein
MSTPLEQMSASQLLALASQLAGELKQARAADEINGYALAQMQRELSALRSAAEALVKALEPYVEYAKKITDTDPKHFFSESKIVAAAEALRAALDSAPDEGMVMVPRKVTHEMLLASARAAAALPGLAPQMEVAQACWDAMIAAVKEPK